MKKLLLILLLLISGMAFSQTNATFKNLDVRNRTTLRGYNYLYDSTFFLPDGSNIPYWDLSDTLGYVLSVSNPNESQLVKVRLSTLLDSLGISGGADSLYIAFGCFDNLDTWLYNSDTIYIDTCQLWYQDGDTIINVSDYKVRMTDEVYIYPLPPEATKTGRMMHINQFGQVEWMSPATLVDTLSILMPQYWTFVDAATDTLKNNVSTAGVVAVKGNLELQTTNAAATNGVVKQNGVNLIHTYHEKGDNNLFIGQSSGNFTADSSFNIGIGLNALSALTTSRYNTAIGVNALKSKTSDNGGETAIGYSAGQNLTGGYENTLIGVSAGNDLVSGNSNTAIGYASSLKVTGNFNTSVGARSLGYNATMAGARNVAIGYYTLQKQANASGNTAVGNSSLFNNIEGQENTGIGAYTLYNNGDNDGSTAIGYNAMYYADSRVAGERVTYNTAIGYEAMKGSSTAANNTGQYNTATGYQALDGMTAGAWNTVYGYNAGGGITTGDSNILIGTSAGAQLTTQSDQLYIDNTNTTTPLIHGNMRTDYVTINGQFTTDNSFGELFEDAANVTATVATYKTIVSLQAGQSNEATLTDSSMTITQAGTYLVNYSSSFTHSVNNTVCHISLFVNDTEDTSLEAERKIGTAGDYGSMSGTALVTLTANAVLKLKATSDNDGDLTLHHLNFNCTRIK